MSLVAPTQAGHVARTCHTESTSTVEEQCTVSRTVRDDDYRWSCNGDLCHLSMAVLGPPLRLGPMAAIWLLWPQAGPAIVGISWDDGSRAVPITSCQSRAVACQISARSNDFTIRCCNNWDHTMDSKLFPCTADRDWITIRRSPW
jgi:hypothetical protein